MNIQLILEPWSMLLDRIGVERRPADGGKLAVTIDAGTCAIVSLETIRNEWGQTAAGLVASALREGLGRVINVWDPDNLDWIAEWWQESLEMYEDEDDAAEHEAELTHIKEFKAAQQHVRSTYLALPSRSALSEALMSLPAGPIRRSTAALLSSSRRPRTVWLSPGWDRLSSTMEGHPTAAVVITRSANDAVRHAYDEMQASMANSSIRSHEHGILLLDTCTPRRLAASLRQLHRVLRTLAWGEHLVHAILDLQDRSR